MTGGTSTEPADTGRFAAVAQWWRSALSSSGDERDTLLIVAKSTLAATLAWLIAYDVLDARSPAFAPFSAVLMMQVTVYRSVVQSLRYVGAVVAGVLVQAALGFLAGPDLLTFVLVALVALTIGRWRLLGVQGPQVATAAFFAFSTYTTASGDAERFRALGEIVLLVLIGSAIGTAVNVLVAPPLRHRSAEYGIHSLAHTLHGLLADMHPVLAEGVPDGDTTGGWRARAERTGEMIGEARSGLLTSKESALLNPGGCCAVIGGTPVSRGTSPCSAPWNARSTRWPRSPGASTGPARRTRPAGRSSSGTRPSWSRPERWPRCSPRSTRPPCSRRRDGWSGSPTRPRRAGTRWSRRPAGCRCPSPTPLRRTASSSPRRPGSPEEFRYTSQVLLDVAREADRGQGSTRR